MAPVFRAIARLFTAMTIMFSVRPRVMSLLDLLQRPPVRMVAITRRRRVEYASLFANDAGPEECGDRCMYELPAQPEPMASQHTPTHRPTRRKYTPVRSA